MGRLTSRQERFCERFVETANAAAAARTAGYAPGSARATGYRLLRRPRIVERIVELQTETAEIHCRTATILLAKLETVYRRAIEDHQYAVAARAIEIQARLAGIAASRGSGDAGRRKPPPPPSNDNDQEEAG